MIQRKFCHLSVPPAVSNMAENEGQGVSSQSSTGPSTASHLPWHLIPSFEPGETDLTEYTRRLEFLAGIWPVEHLNQLAPRAALQCKGSAFQKVVRIQPDKLKVNELSGVQLLVSHLGEFGAKLPSKTSMRSLNVPFMASVNVRMKAMRVTWPDMRLFLKT